MRIQGKRKLLAGLAVGLVSTISVAATAAAQDDPNLRTPGIYVVEQEGVEVHFVVGDAAWGDVVATLGALREGEAEYNDAIAEELWAGRNDNPPIFLFEVARRSVDSNPERALEAYFLGRVRSIYDASRCLDSTAAGVVNVATEYAGPEVVQLMSERMAEVPALLEQIAMSGEAFTGQASPWWACSFGNSAYYAALNGDPISGPEWLKLETNWPAIRDSVTTNIQANADIVRQALAAQSE